MKKLLGSLMASVLLSSVIHSGNGAFADARQELSLRMDHQMVNMDVQPVVNNGEVFLPIYIIRDWQGIQLQWNQLDKSLTAWAGGQRYVLTNGSDEVSTTAGRDIQLTHPVYIEQGRVMVPLSLFKRLTGAAVVVGGEQEVVKVNSGGRRPLAYGDSRKDVKIFGNNEKDGVYHGLSLEIGGKQHHFPWSTPTGWKEIPQLIEADLTNDGEEEVTVLLNQGSGTGVHAQDVHVIRAKDLTEIPVQSFKEIVKEKVSSAIKHQNGVLTVTVTADGREMTLEIPDEDGSRTDHSAVGFGSVVYHSIENGKLVLRLGGSISPSEFVGELVITYRWSQDKLTAESVQFILFPEYQRE
ncbi:stalk domain-containing protein [Paenibacillus lemnae]|uniref:Copper amine oxidase-like N-terminal domain-containing protein n=1 Tax=Paenibacillus lemnae TaxID=1330551 RepID=A0A848M710_PAELE|nr:stalk domain-containing protein [Paenibacillus lemnae]NMO95980.1 hypothetical protein [Paenibacillus lemnae]